MPLQAVTPVRRACTAVSFISKACTTVLYRVDTVCCATTQANAGPGTNGSQFFITLVGTYAVTCGVCMALVSRLVYSYTNLLACCMQAPTPWLDGKHSIFGRVESGMETIERLGNMQTDASDRPTTPLKILTARQL